MNDFTLDEALIDSYADLRSLQVSVLLAACRRDETAADGPNGGLFTTKLMEKLRKPGSSYLTYSELFHKFKVSEL